MNEIIEALQELKKGLQQQLSEDILLKFQQSIDDIRRLNLQERFLTVQDLFPQSNLYTILGDEIQLRKEFKGKKLIISFLRGSWCPFCNVEVNHLIKNYEKIKSRDAEVVLITPQGWKNNKIWSEVTEMPFPIYQDKDNSLAKALGISFALQDYVLPIYKTLGIDLKASNDSDENVLPVPATYIVDETFKIVYHHFDVDYMNRLNIGDVLKNI
ncbi:peroxiredoxin-like family protein [Myroides injenensis]|nr:redoxin domain-containing protein [Myroides injenensis]